MTETPDPDLRLVHAMAAGDTQALETLYARHGRSILAYLIGQLNDRQLAEEILQDVMLAAWRGAESFRGESKVRKPHSWLGRIHFSWQSG
jgi:RNA polymerase sigma-70 factor, ECF subfamily